VLHWHRTARALCEPFGGQARYAAHKRWCDEYFFLKHRDETRGVADCSSTTCTRTSIATSPTCARSAMVSSMRTCRSSNVGATRASANAIADFQLYRRGRYVEFNLVFDRGTLFGLQSGGRTESILMSLPPLVRWEYGFAPEAGSAEARLADYLRPRDWLVELRPESSPLLRHDADRPSVSSIAIVTSASAISPSGAALRRSRRG
jgi:coproporphyrinogen III oxidase